MKTPITPSLAQSLDGLAFAEAPSRDVVLLTECHTQTSLLCKGNPHYVPPCLYSTVSVFHRVFTPPCHVPPRLYSTMSLLHHAYVPPCLNSTMPMFHRVFTPPCLCSTVSLLHHAYVPPLTGGFYV